MHFTRARDLLFAALIGLGGGLLLFQLAYKSMGSLPVLAGTTLLVLALIELGLAIWVRRRIRSRRLTDAFRVARIVALAKASSLLGAIMAGAWAGALGYLLPRADRLPAAARDTPAGVVGVLSAAALVACALWLEHCCRTPDSEDSDRMGESSDSR